MSFNQVIISTNEDPLYFDFWPVVAKAYKTMFPDVTVHLAFLTWRANNDPVVESLREHGKVTVVKPVGHIAEFPQAKMARFFVAAQQGDDVCYIDDIDVIACHKGFVTDKTEARPKGHLLCVGGEVYNHIGSYPISQMTGEGWLWKTFINPEDKTFAQLMAEWSGPIIFDRREQVTIPLDYSRDDYFSDERLLRKIIHLNPVPKFELPRGYTDFMESTLDRHDWKIDMDKLYAGGYLNAHCLRPYSAYKAEIQPVLDYIQFKYGN